MITSDVTQAEGSSGTTDLVFTVSLTASSGQSVGVDFETQDGTAMTAGSDYTATSGTLTFDPGETSKTVTVAATGDATFEPDEDFTLRLSNATGATIADDTGLGTIQNDDARPAASVTDVARTEGAAAGTTDFAFTVSLSNASTETVTLEGTTEDGTAATGDFDYQPLAALPITFSPGSTETVMSVTVNGDAGFEPDESFALKLADPSNATIADDTGLGTIQNDDARPAASVTDVARTEGAAAGTTDFAFTVSLSNASTETVTLEGTTEDGTAATGDFDYQPLAALPITFSPGSTETVMSVTVNGDAGFEPDESFALKLADPSNATIADDTGLGTIQNDDAQPQVSLDDVSTLEGNQGQTDVTFTVSLASPSTQTITVDYETEDGTATAGSDYAAGSGLLTFDPGQTSESVTVHADGDVVVEDHETFISRLSGATNATIADYTGVGTIQNDDQKYPRPKAATLSFTSLVPAYDECTSPNRVHHGTLVAGGSCNPPVHSSPNVTSGSPDSNGAAANFSGSVRLRVCTGAGPACPGSDVAILATLNDVRCQPGVTTASACTVPNDAAGPDYTGELGLELSLRLTDRRNAYTPGGETDQGTVEDVTLPATIPCLPTAGASTGATCALNTTVNTLIPGAVTFGARAIWELGHVKVNDAGPDGLVSTADGVTPFAVQGVFTP